MAAIFKTCQWKEISCITEKERLKHSGNKEVLSKRLKGLLAGEM